MGLFKRALVYIVRSYPVPSIASYSFDINIMVVVGSAAYCRVAVARSVLFSAQ